MDERKAAEQSLENSDLWLGKIFQAQADAVIIVNLERKIVNLNQAAERMLGYSLKEIIDLPRQIFHVDEEHHARFSEYLDEAFQKGGAFQTEFEFKRKDGTTFPLEITFSPLIANQGKFLGLVGVARDITYRKQVEKELRESNRRLEVALSELQTTQQQVIQQERLRAIGTMASGIAHDFNNELFAILGYTELLLDNPETLKDIERVTKTLKEINVVAQGAAKVVGRLREFYRHREAGEVFQPLDIHPLIEQAISLTQPKWKDQALADGVTVNVMHEVADVPRFLGSESELRELLTNLIMNGVDAMPGGGTLSIRSMQKEDKVILEVSDTGTGMSEEVRRRCFEPFFSTKGERGTGLGLAMVYGIIKRHNGTIEIESELGKGTTFRVILPLQKETTSTVQGEAVVKRTIQGPFRIMVVEDEPRVRDIMTQYLTEDGHTVTAATNGREALEKFRPNTFDLIITDKAMPEMNGDKLASIIKQLEPRRPIILVSGFGDMMGTAGELPKDVDLVLSKPTTLTQLRAAIAKVTGT